MPTFLGPIFWMYGPAKGIVIANKARNTIKGQVMSIGVGVKLRGGALKKASMLPRNAPYA
jgi:hypothetical protein